MIRIRYARLAAATALAATVIATVPATAQAAPTAPSTLTVSATAPITLTWVDSSTTENGFIIERSECIVACSSWARIGWVGRNVTTYTDTAPTYDGRSFVYRVSSFDKTGYSAPSAEATFTRSGFSTAQYYYPPVITVDAANPNLVSADYSATNTPVFDMYGNPTQLPTNWAYGDGAAEQTAAPRTTHLYDVAGTYALSATRSGPMAGIEASYVTVPGNLVTKPAALRASSVTRRSVTLTWTTFPTTATGIEIWMCSGTTACVAGTTKKLTTVSATSSSYTNSSLRSASTYRFWVRGVAGTTTASSDVITVTTLV